MLCLCELNCKNKQAMDSYLKKKIYSFIHFLPLVHG